MYSNHLRVFWFRKFGETAYRDAFLTVSWVTEAAAHRLRTRVSGSWKIFALKSNIEPLTQFPYLQVRWAKSSLYLSVWLVVRV